MRAGLRRGLVLLVGLSTLALPGAASAADRGGPGVGEIEAARAVPPGDGTMGVAARRALRRGYLVPDQRAYEQAKARAQAAGSTFGPVTEPTAGPLAPVRVASWNGIADSTSAPSDSTGAVGTTRYIELINRRFAIYNKATNAAIAVGQLAGLAGRPASDNLFDPQIIWDPQQNRFFYVMDDVVSASDNRLAFGFSKGPSPNAASDFCHYTFNYGAEFPDYPKLGDTTHFITIGVNTFAPGFVGADVAWVTKPPNGNLATCPSAGTFDGGVEFSLEDQATSSVFTPVAVNQTDTGPTGYVVARSGALPASFLSLHKVTRNPDGTANVQNPGQNVAVPSYTFPANAPQPGTPKVLDTLDARPTQAVSAIDPSRGASGVNSIWTQHTINGAGGRSVVRWYEINPGPRTLFQSGTVQNAGLFVFNGAISPDRGVFGATRVGGSNMVLGLNGSSTAQPPGIRMVSKVGAAAQSAMVAVKGSRGSYFGFDCAGADNDCRWGDYAAATPDPNPPAGQTRVWLTNQWASGGTSTTIANWRTWNWAARP